METEIEKRVQETINARMALEIEKQKDTIEAEIQRRVAEARKQMEKELAEELEKQKQFDYKRQLEKEVCSLVNFVYINNYDINNKDKKEIQFLILKTRLI